MAYLIGLDMFYDWEYTFKVSNNIKAMSNKEFIVWCAVILTIVWVVVPDNTERYNDYIISITSNE